MSGVNWEGLIPIPRLSLTSVFPLELDGSSLGKILSIDLGITSNPTSPFPAQPHLVTPPSLEEHLFIITDRQGGTFSRKPKSLASLLSS